MHPPVVRRYLDQFPIGNFFWLIPLVADTNLLDWKLKIFLAGVPRTPIQRIAGAVFRAATDPDPATSGCPWMLPDDGLVLLLQKEVLREGVYDMLNKRVRRTMR